MLMRCCWIVPLLFAVSSTAFIPGFVVTSQSPSTKKHPTLPYAARPSFGMFDKILDAFAKGSTPLPSGPFTDNSPSWDEIKALLEELQAPEEKALPGLREAGRGPASPKALLRLFDAPDGTEPKVTLYRDHAAWCPYCEKVWLYLEEKRIPYKIIKINMRCYGPKPASFTSMVPSGLLPVMELNGQVITESNDIIQALEDNFPDAVPLLPMGSDPTSKLVAPLLRLERQLFGAWLRWLTNPAIVDAEQRARFKAVISDVESALASQGGPYFLGGKFSVVDCIFAPFLERTVASLAYYKGYLIRDRSRYPAICNWFDAMENRSTYQNIKSDWFTHCMDLPPQVGNNYMIEEGKKIAAEIDGSDGRSWNLPLKAGVEPFLAGRDEGSCRREAVAQLLTNPQAVARFATRALGKAGMPPVAAPLADPNAIPNEEYVPLIDSALRSVAWSMLKGIEAVPPPCGVGGNEVALALKYLQDRVGVPRDMSFEAARHFRAYLGWYQDQLKAAAGKA